MSSNGTYIGRAPQALATKGCSLTAEALAQRSLKAIDLYVAGNPLEDIAEALGCAPQTIESIVSNPLAKARILQMQLKAETSAREASLALTRLSPGAVQVLGEALEGNLRIHRRDSEGELMFNRITGEAIYDIVSSSDRIMVARDILDRNRETAKVSKSEITQDTSLVDSEALIRVKENYRQALQRNSVNVRHSIIPEDSPEGDASIGEDLQGQEPAPSTGGQPDGDKS